MTAMTQVAHDAPINDSKSRVGELQREIDKLTLEYHRTGDPAYLTRATRLAREKEQLSKPARMRFAS
ncbi:hypothetical protein GCM10023209_22890 [Roseibacterium beibuensis]|uniref:Uncharacterized protein n=1 Tax=[Roseibacterium] beibuensis TaxID=1193142 RepID=A0ABP9LEY1_9RHOB